jgi:PAS domain S-box-containing protein
MIFNDGAAWFPEDEREGLSLFWDACAAHYKTIHAEIRDYLLACDRVDVVGLVLSEEQLRARDEFLYRAIETGVDTGNFSQLEAAMTSLGTRWSQLGIELNIWYEMSDLFRQRMVPILLTHYREQPRELALALVALQRYADHVTRNVTREYIHERERLLAAQRRSTEDALLRYTRLAESGILGILICDIYGQAKEANDGFLQMLGYSREELPSLNWVKLTPPEWRKFDEAAIVQLQAEGRTQPWEKEYFRKDGSRVPILVGVAQLTETDGIAFVLDISERKRLEELRLHSQELELQNLRIAEASRMKSEFLANMSHELRTPLNSIIGFSELLHDGEVPRDSPNYRIFVGHILQSGRHLLQLINDVLDLTKVESGKLEFRPEPVELTRLVDEVCAVLRTMAAARCIALDCEVEPSIDQVTLDPSRFKQVLYNYVSNALKFTEAEGKVEIRIAPEDASSFRLEVHDTGIGIATRDQSRLFTEFLQLDAGRSKRHGGTGLGLALTRRIVEAQGGRVGVTSTVGAGSVFFAILPRQPTRASSPATRH